MQWRSSPVTNMVALGAVRPRSARLWIRAAEAAPLRVQLYTADDGERLCDEIVQLQPQNDADNTLVIQFPADLEGLESLHPLTRYRVRISYSDGREVGQAVFETAPAAADQVPESFSVALMSCHQPFDDEGRVRASSRQMLRAALRCMEQYNTKLAFTIGDQIYADSPDARSLFADSYCSSVAPAGRTSLLDCSRDEILQLYHQRYRQFYGLPEWQAIHARVPCYPILDDHEIVDNWGSDVAHQEPDWQRLAAGARAAYLHYQGSRVLGPRSELPSHFGYHLAYGPMAACVLDLRSQRVAGDKGQMLGAEQIDDFAAFLRGNVERQFLFVVLSVPAVHLPNWMAQLAAVITPSGDDFSDRWSAPAHMRDRNRLLRMLYQHQREHPQQQIVLLSGDIHIGCAHEIRWHNELPPIVQLISSGITQEATWFSRTAVDMTLRAKDRLIVDPGSIEASVDLISGSGHGQFNPTAGLNLGIIEIETVGDSELSQLRLRLFSHDGDEPVCVFSSEHQLADARHQT